MLVIAGFALAACSSGEPRVTKASPDLQQIDLMAGLATQIDAPKGRRIQSAVIGNPALADVDVVDNVINIFPANRAGETNLIVRAADEDGEVKVYQYLLDVHKKY
jgi:hypothetical protein